MADLSESVTMSTSASADATLDYGGTNGGSGQTGNPYLDAALLKLRQGGYDAAVLPRTVNDNLWEQFQSTFALTLVEMIALKNHACPVQDELTVNALGRIEKKLDDMGTVDLPMSEATMNFTSSLLEDMKIKYVVRTVNKETGEGEMEKYPWGIKEHEADGQPGCKVILEGEMLPLEVDGASMGMYDVRKCSLPELKAGKRKSNGFSDLAVGPEESMEYAMTDAKDLVLAYTVALVELKTGRADLKPGQLLLQLVSLAFVSGMGQGVVVLGTDCVNKWRLLHFSGYNSVVVQPYTHGKKCIADFKMLIAEGAARMQQNASPEKMTTTFEEDGAEVDMADFGVEETDRDKAIDREAKLRKLASVLGSLYGETPEVPSWAKASETCPSYYM